MTSAGSCSKIGCATPSITRTNSLHQSTCTSASQNSDIVTASPTTRVPRDKLHVPYDPAEVTFLSTRPESVPAGRDFRDFVGGYSEGRHGFRRSSQRLLPGSWEPTMSDDLETLKWLGSLRRHARNSDSPRRRTRDRRRSQTAEDGGLHSPAERYAKCSVADGTEFANRRPGQSSRPGKGYFLACTASTSFARFTVITAAKDRLTARRTEPRLHNGPWRQAAEGVLREGGVRGHQVLVPTLRASLVTS